jgi:hypothetical protein
MHLKEFYKKKVFRDIYTTDLAEEFALLDGKFDVAEDTTDHFWFQCRKCKKETKIVKVYIENWAGQPCIHFELVCPICLSFNQRKIYLSSIEDMEELLSRINERDIFRNLGIDK